VLYVLAELDDQERAPAISRDDAMKASGAYARRGGEPTPQLSGPTMASMTDAPTDELQAFKAAFFRALAHPVRIRILELLVTGERSVQELQEALSVDQPVVSQQLAVLRAGNIVSGRKEGVSVRYTVRDPLIEKLLDTARQIFNNHLVGTQDLLRELQRERRRR